MMNAGFTELLGYVADGGNATFSARSSAALRAGDPAGHLQAYAACAHLRRC
jgi:hypothetical protein